ncbi:MAG: 50S ribosomal protein L18 [Planctomycetota bacterium]|nr:MAG: 50S ribosomal protein L18 [Planctomycetota bacterium]REJ93067.1 MAG: 50S ribosomal protein L18 [Planctomycetota bacterium]REK30055.1 MAG: 50S ribosomal protein L18 [Planctomycetota bacterium]REK37703.1 MAG: 50S ribosomal protein L18 [Planctomycetota bacterium]
MKLQKRISKQRERRRYRVRNRARKIARPRLSVFRSNKHISAQIIDDTAGKTLVSASSMEADLAGATGGNTAAAAKIGEAIGKRALDAGIKDVAFDRGEYRFHGRVAALAEAARKAGLSF